MYYNREEATLIMNEYGGLSRPFFFFTDYQLMQIYINSPEEVDENRILFNINGCSNQSDEIPEPGKPVEWNIDPVTFETYERAFLKVKGELLKGNSYLVNLTFATPVTTNISLREIFDRAAAPYKLWVKDQFVVFSPETFVRIENDEIASYPMKGTIDATIPDARQLILENEKEAAEHATITDLIRNDLSMVAEQVNVTRYRYIDEIVTNRGCLYQVSSEIKGKLTANWKQSIGTILFRLLPAGSITGAPKPSTLRIISETEHSNRGYYTGIMGYFDGEKLDSGVMIRFIEQEPDHLLFHSGGGITWQSDAKEEYNELIQKIYVPFR